MKITIIGAGAMGCTLRYLLKNSSAEISLLENSASTVKSIKNGLTIVKNNGEKEVIYPQIDNDPQIISESDFVIIFVKSYSTERVMQTIKDYCNEDCTIVSLQNGIGNIDIIKKYIPENKIIFGSTTIGGAKTSPNTILLGGIGNIKIGGQNSTKIKDLNKIFTESGIPSSITPDPLTTVWEKAIINASINPIGAIAQITNGEILNNSYFNELQDQIIQESVAVADEMGINIDKNSITNTVKNVCANTSHNRCSMLQDITAEQQTEIDSINGKIIYFGDKLNIKTPINKVLYSLIKGLEEKNSLEK